ncbi:MAG: helix-turn-helix domain-containing protein [Oscillospiraceae bacterium]
MTMQQQAVAAAISYMKSHLSERVTLEQTALAAGYSKYHLERLFRQQTGQTVHRYLQQLRLAYAAEQLRTTRKPVVEIALDACYESQPSFTTAFKQRYGVTPQVYRQQHTRTLLSAGIHSAAVTGRYAA